MAYEIDGEAADAAAVRAAATKAKKARGAETRAVNGTAAKERRGKHVALSAEQKATREAERAGDRKRRSSQRATAQAEREVALSDDRDRAALLRLILLGQQQDDLEAAKRPRRMPIVVKVDQEPRVTAAGGKRLYRRFEELTGGASASAPASRVASDGLYSIVVRITPRGFGETGKKRWRRNEAANLVRYITRADALERVPGLSVLSNLVDVDLKDAAGRVLVPGSDEWAREHFALWQAIEKLEADAAEVIPGKSTAKANVYKHIIIPLPFGLDADERLELMRRITDVFRARDLPFVAVVHEPDLSGDQRNFHVHIMVSERPMLPVGPFEWQFEALKDREVFTPEYLLAFRIHVAEQFNHALAQAGSDRVYTHLSRNDRNVEAVAEEHEGRDRTVAKRRADNLPEVTRQLDVARERRARIDALLQASRELARVLRSGSALAGQVLAEVRESVGLMMRMITDGTDLSIETAQTIAHATVSMATEAAAPMFELTEVAPVRHLPVSMPPAEVAPEVEFKAIEAPASPEATAIVASFEPDVVPQATPETIRPVEQPLDLTPYQRATAIMDEMQFDEAEKIPITTLLVAMKEGRLAIAPEPGVSAAQVSTDDLSAARSASVVAETDRGRAFMARIAMELAPLLPTRDAQSDSFVLKTEPEGASWRGGLADRVLPVVFRDWNAADRHMRSHLNLLVRAMVDREQHFCAGLGGGLWWYYVGGKNLEGAATALRRDPIGLRILQELAGASETSLGSLRSDVALWRSDQPNEPPRPMTAETLRARDGYVEPRTIERVAERRVEAAAAPAPDLFAEAMERIKVALTGQSPRARILSVNGKIEALVRDVELVADLALVSRRGDGVAFFRQRAREVPELPIDNGWIRRRVAEAPDAGAAHAEMLRRLQQQRGGTGR